MHKSLLPLTVVIVISVGTGLFHGRYVNRWGLPTEMVHAAKKIKQIPEVFGDWSLVSESQLEDTALDMLKCRNYASRVYRNNKTGEQVSLVLLLGPPGPISVHTPEICYSSVDYKIQDNSERVKLNIGDKEHTFSTVSFGRHSLTPEVTRVWYGWTQEDSWSSPDNPRFAFGASPYLFKIQLASIAYQGTDFKQYDPCRSFLEQFLPVLHQSWRTAT